MSSLKLPSQTGTILLGGAVTFPHGVMPLHIFEPRYRDMLNDAITKNCMICVANLKTQESDDLAKCASKIGYIGIIRAAAKQEDGCSNLILHCLSRVEFTSWEEGSVYPKANIRPLLLGNRKRNEGEEITIRSLRDAVSRHLISSPKLLVSKTNEVLDRFGDCLDTLTDVVAQQFVEGSEMRQSLLEDLDPMSRAEVLIRYLRLRKYII